MATLTKKLVSLIYALRNPSIGTRSKVYLNFALFNYAVIFFISKTNAFSASTG